WGRACGHPDMVSRVYWCPEICRERNGTLPVSAIRAGFVPQPYQRLSGSRRAVALRDGGCAEARHQRLAEGTIALEVPFAAHRRAAAGIIFDMQHRPAVAARTLGAGAGVMTGEPALKIERPADISAAAAVAEAAEDVNDAIHPQRITQ